MGWDGMGWNALGWDGMRWERDVQSYLTHLFSEILVFERNTYTHTHTHIKKRKKEKQILQQNVFLSPDQAYTDLKTADLQKLSLAPIALTAWCCTLHWEQGGQSPSRAIQDTCSLFLKAERSALFLLECSCFTALCSFLLHNEVNQLYACIHICLPSWTSCPPNPPFHLCRSSQSTELNFLFSDMKLVASINLMWKILAKFFSL